MSRTILEILTKCEVITSSHPVVRIEHRQSCGASSYQVVDCHLLSISASCKEEEEESDLLHLFGVGG